MTRYRKYQLNRLSSASRFPSFRLLHHNDKTMCKLRDTEVRLRLTRPRQEEIKREGLTTEVVEKYRTVTRKRWMKAILIHIALILALLAYSFIGAAIFKALEEETAEETIIDVTTAKTNLLEEMWNQSQNKTVKKEHWLQEADVLLTKYDKKIAFAIEHGIDIEDRKQHQQNVTNQRQVWDLWNSLFFAGTVYTTIGYGHLYPVTTAGKIATMIYAVIGIPLCLIVLADMGGLFSEFLKSAMRACKRHCCGSKQRGVSGQKKVDDLSGVSVVVCLVVICVAYLFTGAAIYTIWEDWTYLDSFYFMFISFSTIGLGDVVPNHPKFFLITFFYIFFGLALLSTFLTLVQQVLQSTINIATDQLETRLGYDSTSNSSIQDDRDGVNLVNMSQTADDRALPPVEL